MQTFPLASVATPWLKAPWLKGAARVAFTLLFIKGAAWAAMTWLALRGFGTL